MKKKTSPRLTEEQEAQKAALIRELKKGEESGIVENFDFKEFLKQLNENHIKKKNRTGNRKPRATS